MILLAVLFAAFCAAVLFAFHSYFRTGKERPAEERFVIAVTPLLAVLMFMQLSYSVMRMPDRDWNAARITPSVAWTMGHDVYYPATEGPILNTLYGPGTVLAFAPSALGTDPTSAILIAGAINVGSMSLPLLLLFLILKSDRRDLSNRALRWLCWVLTCGSVYVYFGTAYAITSIHADAPAMGMMVLAATIIVMASGELSVRRLALSAFLAALSCFTKQIEVFALPGLFFFIGLAFSWRCAFIYAGLVAGWAVALAIAFGMAMGGFNDMMFNIVEVPSLHEWKGPKLSILIKSGIELTLSSVFLLFLLLPFICRDFHRKGHRLSDISESCFTNRWIVFAFIGITMVPGSLMGEVKVGGMENSYHTLYYLMIAAGLALFGWVSAMSEGEQKRAALVGIYLIAALVIGIRVHGMLNLLRARSVWNNTQQEAYEFAKAHPNQTMFPWNPLSTLYADGKVYHFEYGVYDRVFAGFKPEQEHFEKHIPEDLTYIIWRHRRECFQIPQHLPTFNQRANVSKLELPLRTDIEQSKHDPMEPPELNEPSIGGWMVLTRE